MKKKILTLLTLALAVSGLVVTKVRAQDRTPAPAEKAARANPFPGDNMPVQRRDVSPLSMPTPGMQGGMVDRKTGKYILYNDSRTGLGYNFEKQEIIDYRT
ncbi:MAG TPA: hypothetical protein VF646_01020, partial [Cytophagales bacterium]